jgi:cytochrome c2
MNQRKYIMYAILLVVVGGVIFLVSKRFTSSKNFENPSTIIDFAKTVDSSHDHNVDGKSLFLTKCASCHNLIRDMAGPALAEIRDRGSWSDSKRLYNYIRHPESLDRNKYIDSLRKVYGTKHLAFPELSDEEIKAILSYLNADY